MNKITSTGCYYRSPAVNSYSQNVDKVRRCTNTVCPINYSSSTHILIISFVGPLDRGWPTAKLSPLIASSSHNSLPVYGVNTDLAGSRKALTPGSDRSSNRPLASLAGSIKLDHRQRYIYNRLVAFVRLISIGCKSWLCHPVRLDRIGPLNL